MSVIKKVLLGFGVILGVYLIGRAIVEPFIIDYGNPLSYRHAWGGPSLAGVLAIHCGFGLLSAVLIGVWLRRNLKPRRPVAAPRLDDKA